MLSVTDQIIENETEYRGNIHGPSVFTKKEKGQIKKGVNVVGEYMRDVGFRGVAGADFLISDGETYFVEINPRKNHSTVINNRMLEETRPDDIPPLPYLESETILNNGSNYDLSSWEEPDISWDMYILKKKGWSQIVDVPLRTYKQDHAWDFNGSYVANIPYPVQSIIHKSYASQKSEGHTRRTMPGELVRIVSPDLKGRMKTISQINKCFRFLGD